MAGGVGRRDRHDRAGEEPGSSNEEGSLPTVHFDDCRGTLIPIPFDADRGFVIPEPDEDGCLDLAFAGADMNVRKGAVPALTASCVVAAEVHDPTTAGHSIDVLTGRIRFAGSEAPASDFLYRPPNVVHDLVEPSEILIRPAGPLDFPLSEADVEE